MIFQFPFIEFPYLNLRCHRHEHFPLYIVILTLEMVKQHLQVFARLKPLQPEAQPLSYLELNSNSIELQISRAKLSNAKENHLFNFHQIFPPNSTQQSIFEGVAQPVIDNCLDGYNGTIFAYGQTGSGKTYTMSGGDLWPQRGIIPRVLTHIFEQFQRRSDKYSFELHVSFIEIYNENAFDLLDPKHTQSNLDQWTKIVFMEDEEANLQMKNLSVHQVNSEEQALNLLMLGSYIRKTNSTQSNQVSSRSHSIFTLNVKAKNLQTGTQLYSKIHLVDLAGSERVSKSQAEGILLTEAKSINLSLTYLEQVIVSLNQKMKSKGKTPHIPYRNSLLTTLLKDSLGGNCKTVMIATISMERSNQDETVSTLRFAQRVKLIENQMNKNQKNVFANKIEMLERQNAMLKRKITKFELQDNYDGSSEEDLEKVEMFMNNQSNELVVNNLGQSKRYFKTMKSLYQKKLSEYVRQLTFISQKLTRYEEIVGEKNRRKIN